MTPISIALIGWAAAVAALDFRSQRIPNLALASVLLLTVSSLVVNQAGPLGVSATMAVLGAAIPLVLLPGYAAGWLGAGDVKLASTMGMLVGPVPVAAILVVAAGLLGAAALARVAQRRTERLPAAPMLATGFATVVSLAAFA